MQLDSYLEIFTTYYGWAFANIIGEVITGTGLVVLPFAWIIFDTWRQAKERGLQSAGVLPLLEAAQTRLIVAMFVLAVCFATTPITSLSNSALTYVPRASVLNPSPTVGSSSGGTGTTFDTAMSDFSDGSISNSGHLSYVPLWWYTVMAVSSGLNNAVRDGVKGATSRDLRVIENMARTATVEDPKLLRETQDFYNQCYLPAATRYAAMDKADLSPGGQAIIDEANQDYGPTDVDWIGSQLFRTEAEFYPTMHARQPVPGWTIDFSRDQNYCNPSAGCDLSEGVANPEWGMPTCQQWWEDGSIGLREKLISHSSFWRKFNADVGTMFPGLLGDQRKDKLAELAVTQASPQFVTDHNIVAADYTRTKAVGRYIGSALGTVGLTKLVARAGSSIVPLMMGLPMAQAFVLMIIYMFLPLVVFLSGFSLRALFYGAVAIFTVKLWSVMWFIAQWIDARMISAMYPGLKGSTFFAEFTHRGEFSQTDERMILNILMLILFLGMPLVWTSMMMWLGWNLGSGLDVMNARTGVASQSAGQQGLGTVAGVAKGAGGAAGKALR